MIEIQLNSEHRIVLNPHRFMAEVVSYLSQMPDNKILSRVNKRDRSVSGICIVESFA